MLGISQETAIDAIIRLGQSLEPLQAFFGVAMYVAAFLLAMWGGWEIYQQATAGAHGGSGGRGPGGWGGVGMTFLVAVILLAFPQAMGAGQATVFGSSSPLSYTGVEGVPLEASVRQAVGVFLGYMALLGWIFFARGWLLLRRAAQGRSDPSSGSGPAWTHIIGGIFLANIVGTVNVLSATLTGRAFFTT